mmetsp:Transcript_103083/g.300665  ORF Transcript_103083/g.300665 Transcript_103083/m.300665 type:complete len:264 (+) Transcript_103083:153-944(+)
MEGNNHGDPELASLLQKSVRAQGQPEKVRADYVKKVLGLVAMQALAAIVIASPLLFKCKHFLKAVLYQCDCADKVINGLYITNLTIQFIHLNYACGSLQCGRKKYIWLLSTSPWNSAFMLVYAVVSGLVMGFCSWLVQPRTLIIMTVCFVAVIALLSAFSVWTSRDFSANDFTKVLRLLMLASVVIYALNPPKSVDRALEWCWVIFFLCLMVQHTQLIFGTARPQHQFLEYSIDMYGYAAFVLFIIYINMYSGSLKAFLPTKV